MTKQERMTAIQLDRMSRAGLLRFRSVATQGRVNRAIVRAQQDAHVEIDIRTGKPVVEETLGPNESWVTAPDSAFM